MTMAIVGTGNVGCPCINQTLTLAAMSDRHCKLPNTVDGFGIQLTTTGGSCVPFSYGSSRCIQHDILYDPNCNVGDAGDNVIPAYCVRPWCYVDLTMCKKDSDERLFRSSYFPAEAGLDVFYSYTTCNSTADDWLEVEEEIVGNLALGGISIDANIPLYQFPMMYKSDSDGSVLTSRGSEYYDDTIPYGGVYIHHANQIVKISNGDIHNITLTHRSRASGIVHPSSSYTAAVQDIEDGLISMGVGPFWITAQRLKMVSFTIPIIQDKTVLVIPKPGTTDLMSDQIRKVLAPISYPMWGVVLVIITITALLSVWFSDRTDVATDQRSRRMLVSHNTRRRKRAYARLALDACLQKGTFFCSAGVEQDQSASLSHKLLLFGFGFFILISVSAYVANLAAFLTNSTTNSVKTMDGAIQAGFTICAHPALKAEFEVAWPDAKFYFHQEAREFPGVLEDYDDGKCNVMAIGLEDTSMDQIFLEKLCSRNLVYTTSLVAETPIAFPIRSDLAAGLSYWMYQGERYNTASIQTAKDAFPQDTSCEVHLSSENSDTSDYDAIRVPNFLFPILFFGVCACIAVIIHIFHLHNVKNGRRDVMGRRSSMDLVVAADQPRKRGVLKSTGNNPWSEKRNNCSSLEEQGEGRGEGNGNGEFDETDSLQIGYGNNHLKVMFKDEEKEVCSDNDSVR